MERTLSGYCRTIDAARIVLCEKENGETDIGCDFCRCVHREVCPIAREIEMFLKQTEEH